MSKLELEKTGKKRWLTTECYDGCVEAWAENDARIPEIFDGDELAQWVWVYADSEEEAKAMHHIKHDQWQSDVESGQPEKATY